MYGLCVCVGGGGEREERKRQTMAAIIIDAWLFYFLCKHIVYINFVSIVHIVNKDHLSFPIFSSVYIDDNVKDC